MMEPRNVVLVTVSLSSSSRFVALHQHSPPASRIMATTLRAMTLACPVAVEQGRTVV